MSAQIKQDTDHKAVLMKRFLGNIKSQLGTVQLLQYAITVNIYCDYLMYQPALQSKHNSFSLSNVHFFCQSSILFISDLIEQPQDKIKKQ